MIQCKIFMGEYKDLADKRFNEWMREHANIEIVNYFYKQSRYGDHSICIFYKEN